MSIGITASSYTGIAGGLGDGTAFANAVLAENPRAYWRLDETSGTTVNDLSGNSHTATYNGSPTFDAIGLLQRYNSRSTYFNNISSLTASINCPAAAWMDAVELTLTCMIIPNPGNGLRMIATRYHDPNNDRSFFLYQQNGRFMFYVRDRYTPSLQTIVDSGYSFVAGRVYFVAAYSSATETGIRVYDETGLVASATGAGRDVYHSSRNLVIGCDDTGAYFAEMFLSDFAYFGHIVPPTQLDQIAAIGLSRKPRWIQSIKGTLARNGTNIQTVTYPETTAGSLLVAIFFSSDEPETMQTPGWTQRYFLQAPNTAGNLSIYTRNVNAGETSFTISYPSPNYPLNYAVFELPSGSSFHSVYGNNAPTAVPQTLSGLPGTPVLVFAVVSESKYNSSNAMCSSEYRYGWLEEVDSNDPSDDVTYGSYLSIGYQDYVTQTSIAPNYSITALSSPQIQMATVAFVVQ